MDKHKFKKNREFLDLTQEELAVKLFCSVYTIRAYEQGKRKPLTVTLEKFKELIEKLTNEKGGKA